MTKGKTYLQGDLCIHYLSDEEAARFTGEVIKAPQRGSIRLLEGEVTGHHHEIVMDAPTDETNAEAIAATQIALAKAKAAASRGTATLLQNAEFARSLPWLLRTDLMIGFLRIDGGPVNLIHPEHDTIKLPAGVAYVGRQVESAGAEERQVQD
jgi:hypothetical protein